ncbi:MAG: aminotransferase class I/II-fold pyridoxal phosphate-dependent enzyme [Planctomycetota bacterium]
MNPSNSLPTPSSSLAPTLPDPSSTVDDFGWTNLKQRLRGDKVTRIALGFFDRYRDQHLKDLQVDEIDDQRRMKIGSQTFINFGSDSFLGLDRDPRVHAAMREATPRFGSHNGASRAFWSLSLTQEVERRLARWLGVPQTLLFASVTLANVGLIPALAGKGDLLIVDRQSHDSIHQGVKIAQANGAVVRELFPCQGAVLRELLERETTSARHRGSLLTVDGIYSMTGKVAPLVELQEVMQEFGGTLYVDDAHGTGVVGSRGRGAAFDTLGSLKNILMVGSLSKAFSCLGSFITCDDELQELLKIKSSTFIFGGPIPPPYLAAIWTVCEILDSAEGEQLLATLRERINQLATGLRSWNLRVLSDQGAIVSVVVGDIEKTFAAGKWLFDRGFYVQSATYPAVPIQEGLLRIQVNANHSSADMQALIDAMGELQSHMPLPRMDHSAALVR